MKFLLIVLLCATLVIGNSDAPQEYIAKFPLDKSVRQQLNSLKKSQSELENQKYQLKKDDIGYYLHFSNEKEADKSEVDRLQREVKMQKEYSDRIKEVNNGMELSVTHSLLFDSLKDYKVLEIYHSYEVPLNIEDPFEQLQVQLWGHFVSQFGYTSETLNHKRKLHFMIPFMPADNQDKGMLVEQFSDLSLEYIKEEFRSYPQKRKIIVGVGEEVKLWLSSQFGMKMEYNTLYEIKSLMNAPVIVVQDLGSKFESCIQKQCGNPDDEEAFLLQLLPWRLNIIAGCIENFMIRGSEQKLKTVQQTCKDKYTKTSSEVCSHYLENVHKQPQVEAADYCFQRQLHLDRERKKLMQGDL